MMNELGGKIMSEKLEKLLKELDITEIIKQFSHEEMKEELIEFAENSGFANYEERIVSQWSEQKTEEMFLEFIKSMKDEM